MNSKKVNRFELLLLALAVAPSIFLAIVWSHIPARIATHWNIHGQPDRWGSPAALWLFAGLSLFFYFLLRFIPQLDPKRQNIDLSGKGYGSLRLALQVFFCGMSVLMALAALGVVHDVARIVMLGVLLLFFALGNAMSAIRPNYMAGIRTPWTLSSEEVWRKTHRLGARCWVINAIAQIPLVFLLPGVAQFVVFMSGIVFSTLVPVIYSYRLWKKLKNEPVSPTA